eukprot:7386642-Prymnesium_polylepis.2
MAVECIHDQYHHKQLRMRIDTRQPSLVRVTATTTYTSIDPQTRDVPYLNLQATDVVAQRKRPALRSLTSCGICAHTSTRLAGAPHLSGRGAWSEGHARHDKTLFVPTIPTARERETAGRLLGRSALNTAG